MKIRSANQRDATMQLYRCYNKDGVLLWIGVTDSLKRAQEGLRQTRSWTDQIAWVEVDYLKAVCANDWWTPTDREKFNRQLWKIKMAAIKKLKPLHNRAGNDRVRLPASPWEVR